MGNKVRRDRPLGVTILGVLLLLAGILAIIGGLTLGAITDLEGLDLAIEVVSLVIGLVYIIVAFGFFKGWGFVWLLTMIVVVFGIIWSILSWVIGGLEMDKLVELAIDLIVPIIILLYMNSQNVKTFFRRS